MKNIHILPTDKPSKKGDVVIWNGLKIWDGIGEPPHHNQNIYITSDEKPKVGDWLYCIVNDMILTEGKETSRVCLATETNIDWSYKIILTTDQDLIKDGVQTIPDDFLEWFVKNPSCEEVEVEKYLSFGGGYQIFTPKEEPIDLVKFIGNIAVPLAEDILTEFRSKKSITKEYVDDQDAYGYDIVSKEEPKPKLTNQKYLDKMKNDGIAEEFLKQETFEEVDGRKYNKEDLKTAFTKGHDSARMKNSYKSNGTFEEDWNEWFEQFKKK